MLQDPTSHMLHKRPRSSPQAAFPDCDARETSPILSSMTCHLSSLSNSTSNSNSIEETRHADPSSATLRDDDDRLRQRRRIEERASTKRKDKKGKRSPGMNIRLITPHTNETSSGISMSMGCMQLDTAISVLQEEGEESIILLEGEDEGCEESLIVGEPAKESLSAARQVDESDAAIGTLSSTMELHQFAISSLQAQDAEYTALLGAGPANDAVAAGWTSWSRLSAELHTLQRSSVVGSLSKVMEYLHCSRAAYHSAISLLDFALATSIVKHPDGVQRASWYTSIAQCFPDSDKERTAGFVFRGLIAASVLVAAKTRDICSPSPQVLVQTIWGAERSLMSTKELQQALLRCELSLLTLVSFRVHRVTVDEVVSSIMEHALLTAQIADATMVDYVRILPRLLVDHIAVHGFSSKPWCRPQHALTAVELGSAITRYVLGLLNDASAPVERLYRAAAPFLLPSVDCEESLRQCHVELRSSCSLTDGSLTNALHTVANLAAYTGASMTLGTTKEEVAILEHRHQTERCRYANKIVQVLKV